MLCLANPDLQWHSPFIENKNQTHYDDGLQEWIRRDVREVVGGKNTALLRRVTEPLSGGPLEKLAQAVQGLKNTRII